MTDKQIFAAIIKTCWGLPDWKFRYRPGRGA